MTALCALALVLVVLGYVTYLLVRKIGTSSPGRK